ncbi:MAG: serine/threonine protein phosphatase [Clostridium sp.]|uniref:serine/threonine protein phosphatase n=1 Tax=Clostridium sp. TaxID=1506 RepID=UPI002906E841|nr:serine/threonine protein phosphatase [Clostridium sp.]MDU7338435.1 serine/threonine protein phosphatase [Clostridium sp.]
MGWFRTKKSSANIPTAQTALRSEWQAGWNWNRCTPLSGGEQRLYGTLRESVPLISAALEKTVRLIGTFYVDCPEACARRALDAFLKHVPVGTAQTGIQAFLSTYLDQMLTYGTAVGEILLRADASDIAGLYNARLEHLELHRGENPLGVQLCVRGQSGELVPVRRPDLVLFSALNPQPGEVRGVSILRGLPFMGEILMKIYHTIGVNWDRVGNARFAVTYKPSGEGDRAFGAERARQIAEQWSRAMQPGAGVSDFVAVGDVSIRVIGADNQILDSQIPVRQLLEQIVAKLGVPPFLLGLSWSSTERMSSQQSDLLTSELESYRRLLEPVIEKICRLWLSMNGYSERMEIVWEDISLQDTVDLAGARLKNAQAAKLEWDVQKEKEGKE